MLCKRRISSLKLLSALFFFTSHLPGHTLGQSDDASTGVSSSSGGSGGGGASSFKLKPVDAIIFSLSIIFILITALQLLSATFNVPKHFSSSTLPFCTNKNTVPSFPLPSPMNTNPIPLYALGPIFPIALTMAALCLLITWILRATFWGTFFNRANGSKTLSSDSEKIIAAWAVFTYLGDAFTAMSLFSFVCFRIRRLCYCTCRGKIHVVKRVFDMVLVFALFVMGTTYVGYRAHLVNAAIALSGDNNAFTDWNLALKQGDLMRLVQLRRANEALLVFAAVEVFVSAVLLYNHAGKYLSAPDRKVAMLIGTVIAPLFLTYSLYLLITNEVLLGGRTHQTPTGFPADAICLILYGGLGVGTGFCDPSNLVGLEVGRVIVTCLTLSTIIWMLLKFSGASLVDALKGRSSTNASPQEHFGGQVYVHTHGLTYKC